ncbi:MAG: ribonuclease T2, partial [Pseudomonadota bacterium]
MRAALLWFMLVMPALAQEHRTGVFDYYVLSLSWSPNWCTLEGDARGSEQCAPQHDHGWILHGLWPQYERGYPAYCKNSERAPSRRMTREMADVMGTSGLAWHQWKKHGTCSGLSATDYYSLSRAAYRRIARPEVFRRVDKAIRLPATVVEEAFLEANPDLGADGITVTCKQGHIQEARICLTRDLELRRCGGDVLRDCS